MRTHPIVGFGGGGGRERTVAMAIMCFAPPHPPQAGGCSRGSKDPPPNFEGAELKKNMFWNVFRWVGTGFGARKGV